MNIFPNRRSAADELGVCMNVWELRSADDSSLTEGDLTANTNHSLSFFLSHPPSSSAATRSNTEAEQEGMTQNIYYTDRAGMESVFSFSLRHSKKRFCLFQVLKLFKFLQNPQHSKQKTQKSTHFSHFFGVKCSRLRGHLV